MKSIRDIRGLSVLEVMVAVGLLSVAVGFMGKLMTRPQQLVDNATARLTEAAQADLGLFDLGKQLQATHVMKSGIARCTGGTITDARAAEPQVRLAEEGPRFTFAYSQHSSIVALSPDSASEVIAMDEARFPVGSVILLTHINDPAFGGVFRVTAADPSSNRLLLSDTFATVPAPIPCSKGPRAVTMFELTNDDTRLIFNERPRTFRADVLKFASYRLAARPGEAGLFNVMVDEWPKSDGDGVATRLVAERTVDFVVSPGWDDDGSAEAGGRAGGTFRASFAIRRQELGVTADSRLSKGETGESAKGRVTRTLAGSVSYPVGGSLRINFGAPTSPASTATVFPSCAVYGTPMRGVFRMAQDRTRSMNLMRVSAMVTSLGGRVGTFEVSLSGTPAPLCWPSTDATQFDFTTQPVPELLGAGYAQGVNIPATIRTDGTVSYEPLYCDMPPGSNVSAQLVYFDENVKRPVKVRCSGFASNAGGNYVYSGDPSRCSLGGVVQLGTIVDEDTGEPGPTLYTDETSCDWSPAKTGARPGACSIADDGVVDPARTLTRVRLRPAGISISDPSCNGLPQGCREVVCN